ncbi:hypothetical protein C8T65DRAFT_703811 [Cerioporus squamosus]|nr:hypothetical protein C8T65DRAFT_703811 [Cerioporus squamosus]
MFQPRDLLLQYPFLAQPPTDAHIQAGEVVHTFKSAHFNLAVGQIYKIDTRIETFGRIQGIIMWTPPQDDPENGVEPKPLAIVGVTSVLRGVDLSLNPQALWPNDEDILLELVTGTRQLVDTDDLKFIWWIDLEDRIYPLEFNPWQRNMAIYPIQHYWLRRDVSIVVQDVDTPDMAYIIKTYARDICSEHCTAVIPRTWGFDRGPWRCCTLCDREEGRWYHEGCLGEPLVIPADAADKPGFLGGLPDWLRHLSSWHAYDDDEVFWQKIREVPLTRGGLHLGGPSTLSFETVLLDDLLKEHIFQPVEGPSRRTETKYRVLQAATLFSKISDTEGVRWRALRRTDGVACLPGAILVLRDMRNHVRRTVVYPCYRLRIGSGGSATAGALADEATRSGQVPFFDLAKNNQNHDQNWSG